MPRSLSITVLLVVSALHGFSRFADSDETPATVRDETTASDPIIIELANENEADLEIVDARNQLREAFEAQLVRDEESKSFDRYFDVLTYGGLGSAGISGAAQRMQLNALWRIRETDERHPLTTAQRDKLKLAAKGDFARLRTRAEDLRQRIKAQCTEPFAIEDLDRINVRLRDEWADISRSSLQAGKLFELARRAIESPSAESVAKPEPQRESPKQITVIELQLAFVSINQARLRAELPQLISTLCRDEFVLPKRDFQQRSQATDLEVGSLERFSRRVPFLTSVDFSRSPDLALLLNRQIANIISKPRMNCIDGGLAEVTFSQNAILHDLSSGIGLAVTPNLDDAGNVELDLRVQMVNKGVTFAPKQFEFSPAIGAVNWKTRLEQGQSVVLPGIRFPAAGHRGIGLHAGAPNSVVQNTNFELFVIVQFSAVAHIETDN